MSVAVSKHEFARIFCRGQFLEFVWNASTIGLSKMQSLGLTERLGGKTKEMWDKREVGC